MHRDFTKPEFGLWLFPELNEDEKREVLDRYSKVLVVRHPLARIYSIYKNKVALSEPSKNCKCYPYQQYLAPKIAKAIRSGGATMNYPNCTVSVTFEEFAGYYAENPEMQKDRHLIPIAEQCDPCAIDYDYFLRLETGDTDQDFFLETLLQEKMMVLCMRMRLLIIRKQGGGIMDLLALKNIINL